MDNCNYPSFICEADRVPHETDPGYSVTEGVVEAAAAAPAVEEIPDYRPDERIAFYHRPID